MSNDALETCGCAAVEFGKLDISRSEIRYDTTVGRWPHAIFVQAE